MNRAEIKTLLHEFKRGKVTADNVIDAFSSNIIEPLDFATLDRYRELRQGFPEVIFCEGKSENQVAEIAKRIVDHGSVLMATRATNKHYAAVRKVIKKARYNPRLINTLVFSS